MGSTGTRKSADKLRINTPIDSGHGSGGADGTGSDSGTPPQDINNVCPLTIRVKLARQDTYISAELILTGNKLRLAADRSVEVGVVSPAILKTLQTCLSLGINYPSVRVVEDKQGIRYAEFTQ